VGIFIRGDFSDLRFGFSDALRLKFGSTQPSHWVVARQHIADVPEGRSEQGASKAKVSPPGLQIAGLKF
jgi:hypothetical protein